MKMVLFVNAVGEISGAERSLLVMCDALDGTDWRPLVAAPDGPLLQACRAKGITTFTLPIAPLARPRSLAQGWRTLRTIRAGQRALHQLVADTQPEFIHANTTPAMLHVPMRLAAPVIWHVRDLAPLGLVGSRLYRRATQVAVISSAVHQAVQQYAGDGGAQLVLLPPAVDTDRFVPAGDRETVRRQLGLPVGVPLIGVIAQFVPWKRHALFLDALLLMRERPWQAILAGANIHGETTYLDSLSARLAHPVLNNRMTLLPWQADVIPLMQALDLCVLPSQCEPFGRVLIEAMACGTPVIASDDGGVGDSVIDGVTGLRCPGNAGALAAAMTRLLDDADLYAQCAAAGRAHVEEHFSLATHRRQLLALYRSVMAAAR